MADVCIFPLFSCLDLKGTKNFFVLFSCSALPNLTCSLIQIALLLQISNSLEEDFRYASCHIDPYRCTHLVISKV